MEKPPMEWIDNLFICMTQFYGKRWTKQFDKGMPEGVLKSIWQSALYGCNYDSIRNVLLLLQQTATSLSSVPPSHMEFCSYTKGKRPYVKRQEYRPRRNPENNRRSLEKIRSHLRYKDAS